MFIMGATALLSAALGAWAAAAELPSLFGERGPALQLPLAGRKLELAGENTLELKTRPGEVEPGDRGAPLSPGKAFVLSLLVPGLGEIYSGQRLRGAAFLGVEATALGLWIGWRVRGNDLEDDFRKVANANWDPINYLAWRGSTISRNTSITHALPCSTAIVANNTLGVSSDNIPALIKGCGEKQQYYELIGKYNQFIAGWTDVIDPNTGNPVQFTRVDSAENFLSKTRLSYEDDRNDSNKLLKRASISAGFVLLNHVVSAIDAARVAHRRAQGAQAEAIARRTRFVMTLHEPKDRRIPMLMAYKRFY